MEALWQDLRYGIRILLKRPGLTAITVLTLALGIGVNTAVFTVADAVMFRPLPFARPASLVEIWQQEPDNQSAYPGLRREAFQEWSGQKHIFEQVEAYDRRNYALTGALEPETIAVPAVSPGLFPLLGVHPRLGRLFHAEDADNRVALLSEEFWKRCFGGAPDVIGKTVTLDDQPYTVVGVMPPGFKFPYGRFQLWVPLSFSPPAQGRVRFMAIARLRGDVSFEGAQSAVNSMSQRLEVERPDRMGWKARLIKLDERRVDSGPRLALLVLLGAVGFVLLLACVNAANLLLSQAAARGGEIAIRLALGASRLRVVRQLLTESLTLALLGGLGGVLLAFLGVDLLQRLTPEELTFLSVNEIKLDGRVLLFTLGLSVLTGVIFGLVPALRISRPDLQQILKGACGRTISDSANNRLRGALVVAEVGLSVMLLIGAGLMIRSFLLLSNVPPGFEAHNLVAATIALPQKRYATFTQEQEFFNQLKESVSEMPGVEGVTVAAGAPPRGGGIRFNLQMEIEGRSPEPSDPNFTLPYTHVDPNYFQVMRIPLLQGRTFGAPDTVDAPQAVIINAEMAQQYWPTEDGARRRFRTNSKGDWQDVVGVVGDVKVEGLSDRFGKMEVYYPWSQESRRTFQRTLIVRAVSNPSALLPAIKSRIWALDNSQPIYRIDTVDQLLSDSLAEPRFYLMLMSFFAGVALLLVTMGIYGVIAYLVSQRTHEIGIRVALGAQQVDVLRLVIEQGMRLALLGVALGLVGSFALSRLITSLLYGVSATDPATFIIISMLLMGVALLACYLPARRAIKVDPMVALRYE